MEQELETLPEHMSVPPLFSVKCFVDRCLSLCTLRLVIVFSVLLRFTASDYPFGILKPFLKQ